MPAGTSSGEDKFVCAAFFLYKQGRFSTGKKPVNFYFENYALSPGNNCLLNPRATSLS